MKGRTVSWSLLGIVIVSNSLAASGSGMDPWINELHYDNAGTDSGEFVEIAVPWSLTDLASVRLTLYNGGDGRTYGSSHLLSTFSAGDTVEGVTFYSKSLPGLQNGAPDGMSLDVGGSVVHFVSYEGVFTANNGPAAGLTSLDVGLFEGDATPSGSALGLTGTGLGAGDFVWASLASATPGGLNAGQAITVPEPMPTVLAAYLGGGLLLWHRRRRRAR